MGLKREAGVNPAWSRHCNWCDLLVRVAQSLAYLIRLGKLVPRQPIFDK